MNPHALQTRRSGSPAFRLRFSSAPAHDGQNRYSTYEILPAMSILKVARMGHPVLRARAKPLEPGDIGSPRVQQLIDDMFETMHEYQGIGLAAPQVHESVRLFAAGVAPRADADEEEEEEEERIPLMALINPEITVVGNDSANDWEGCLSVPDIRGRGTRAREIKVKAY